MTKQIAIILVLILVTVNVSGHDKGNRHNVHYKINKFKKQFKSKLFNVHHSNKLKNYIMINK